MRGATRSWRRLDGSCAIAALGVTLAPAVAAADPSYWAQQSWDQALLVPVSSSFVPGRTPSVIRQSESLPDATGLIGSFQPGGRTITADNAFFASLGTNGRTCFSCHQPQDGWAIKPETVRATFLATEGLNPMFAAVDGADCPDLVEDRPEDQCCHQGHEHGHYVARFVGARRQLFTKGNFRIFLPTRPNGQKPEWKVRVLYDPYGCEESQTYGLPSGFMSVYRRPLPSTNVIALDPEGPVPRGIFTTGFNIMWDAREPTLESQFTDAVLIHAQATGGTENTLGDAVAQGVSFQSGIFTAQAYDYGAQRLDDAHAKGGPRFLSTQGAGIPPPAAAADLFDAWATTPEGTPLTRAAREAVARGQDLFNGVTKRFTIVDVPGVNDPDILGNPFPGGFCGTCHNDQDRGNDFFLDPKALGIEDNRCAAPNTCGGSTPGGRRALPPPPDEPLFSFRCPVGSIPFFSNPVVVGHHTYDEIITTDPGLGLITGQCKDLGKMKVPILRGLAARAPYFHDGAAATLADVVDFYDQRFDIGFTDAEKSDLVAFLEAL